MERIFKCGVRECGTVRRIGTDLSTWLVGLIDSTGRLIFEHPAPHQFERAAKTHGAIAICGAICAHTHFSRWMNGNITAEDAPACPSPAVFGDNELTAWVSAIYRDETKFGQARVVSYRDMGRDQRIRCFKPEIFPDLDVIYGNHVSFRTQPKEDKTRKKSYVNVVEILRVNGRPAAEYLEELRNISLGRILKEALPLVLGGRP
jgi:hypothetical protein